MQDRADDFSLEIRPPASNPIVAAYVRRLSPSLNQNRIQKNQNMSM